MYAIPPPDRSGMLARVPPMATLEDVDAWIAKHKKPRVEKPPPVNRFLKNVPEFADMAELDAWVQSHKRPNVDRYPVTVTEEEWPWYAAQGYGSGNYRR